MSKIQRLINSKKDFRDFFQENSGRAFYFGNAKIKFVADNIGRVEFYSESGTHAYNVFLRSQDDSDRLWKSYIIGCIFLSSHPNVEIDNREEMFYSFLKDLLCKLGQV